MVGADWIKSDKREDDLAGRPGGIVHVFIQQQPKKNWLLADDSEKYLIYCAGNLFIIYNVQKHAAQGGSEFFFIVNIQVIFSLTLQLCACK